MKDKLITVAVLPYGQAHIFHARLKELHIECELEDLHLIQGDSSASVRIKIMENDLPKVIPELEKLLGHPLHPTSEKSRGPAQPILVPVDFSSSSTKAAIVALHIAFHLKANITFMHSYFNPIIQSIPFGDIYAYDSANLYKIEHAEEIAHQQLKNFLEKVKEEAGQELWEAVKTEYLIKSGYPESDILAYAGEHHPRLIVMGRGGEPEGIMGSVCADVANNANVPVLVIPAEAPTKTIEEYKKVIYATNFDEKDFVTIEKLMGLLEPFDIQLTCVHVGEPRKTGWDYARIEGMKGVLKHKYCDKDFECTILEGTDIAQTLEKYIEENQVDLLALTTHKRNLLARLFNPSIARKMLFHGHTPVLIFHA